MFGQSNISGVPEYARGYTLRDPQEWTPGAYQAPSINQQAQDWARWERATLQVSVNSFDPVTGSHFSLGSSWNPCATSAFSDTRKSQQQLKSQTDELDTKRANVESLLRRSSLSESEKQDVISVFLKNTVLNPSDRVEASAAMLRRSTATFQEKKRTLFSALKANAYKLDNKRVIARAVINALIPDSKTQSATFMQIFSKTNNEDPELGSDSCRQTMNEVTMLTNGREIENDQTRADVESLVRTSPLNAREKVKVVEVLLQKYVLDPHTRKNFTESMIRRCVMSNDERRANIISILQDAELEASSKAEVIAIILEEDSQRGYEFDDNYNVLPNVENMINEVVSRTALPDNGYSTSVPKLRVDPSKTKYGDVESLRSMRDQTSKRSIKPSRSQINGELYSTTNVTQSSKHSNLELEEQSPNQIYGSQRDLKGDISKTTYTGNVESLRSMRDQGSKSSFKPSRSQVDRSQTSALDNASIPPQLHESLTSQGQHSRELYSTSNVNQPSKHSHVELREPSPSQMYGSSMNQVSKASFKQSRSQMDRSHTSTIGDTSIPPQLHESLTSQGQHSGELYSTTNINQSSRHSHMELQESSPSQMYGSSMRDEASKASFKPSRSQVDRSQMSVRDNMSIPPHLPHSSTSQGKYCNMNENSNCSNLNPQEQMYGSQIGLKDGAYKPTFKGFAESIRSIRDHISKASFKPSRSQVDRSKISAIGVPPHIDSSTSHGQKSGELYSSTDINQNSKHSNLRAEGQSPSQIYGSRRDIKEAASRATYNGIEESVRSFREEESRGSHSQTNRGEMSDNNEFVEAHETPSIISHHVPPDEIHSSISLNDDEKLIDLEFQEQSFPKKRLLCNKCHYLKTCGCVKLSM